MLFYTDSYIWTELNTDNSKIGRWSRDLLDRQFKYLCFFLSWPFSYHPLVANTATHHWDVLRMGCSCTRYTRQAKPWEWEHLGTSGQVRVYTLPHREVKVHMYFDLIWDIPLFSLYWDIPLYWEVTYLILRRGKSLIEIYLSIRYIPLY